MQMPITHSVVLAVIASGFFANAAPTQRGALAKRFMFDENDNNNNNILRNSRNHGFGNHGHGCNGGFEDGGFGFGGFGGDSRFDSELFSDNDNQNINQNIDTNQNANVDKIMSHSGTFGGMMGGFGFAKRDLEKRFGGESRSDFGSNNDNQNINQNLLSNQNLMASLPVNHFFSSPRHSNMMGHGGMGSMLPEVNNIDNFAVSNNVEFSDGFFKAKRSLMTSFPDIMKEENFAVSNNVVFADKSDIFEDFKKRSTDDLFFSDNNNQNINQNIDTNQNVNADFFKNMHGFSNTRSFLPFLNSGGCGFKRDLSLNLGVEKRSLAEGRAGRVRRSPDSCRCGDCGGDRGGDRGDDRGDDCCCCDRGDDCCCDRGRNRGRNRGFRHGNANININRNHNSPEVCSVGNRKNEAAPVFPITVVVPTVEKEVPCHEREKHVHEVAHPSSNDVQAVAAPVINNYINTESCSGSDSRAENAAVPQLGITTIAGGAESASAPQLDVDSIAVPQLGITTTAGSDSGAESAAVPQLDVGSCAENAAVPQLGITTTAGSDSGVASASAPQLDVNSSASPLNTQTATEHTCHPCKHTPCRPCEQKPCHHCEQKPCHHCPKQCKRSNFLSLGGTCDCNHHKKPEARPSEVVEVVKPVKPCEVVKPVKPCEAVERVETAPIDTEVVEVNKCSNCSHSFENSYATNGSPSQAYTKGLGANYARLW